MKKAYTNAKVFDGKDVLTGKAVVTDGEKIVQLIDEDSVPIDITRIDLQGKYLAPAFIDLQIYGGNGRLFSNDLSPETIGATYQYCLAGGASRFCITLATNTMEVFYKGIDAVRAYWKGGGKGMPGLHLEGPYLNPLKRGAHAEELIKIPTETEVKELLEYGKDVIKIITVAPERCSDAVLQLLFDAGILISAGHSNANYREGIAAFDKGIAAATHLFNAMSPLQHREPGLPAAIFNHDKVVTSIVPDGIHVDFAAVAISKRLLQERLFIITDAVTETSSGIYQHVFKGDRYTLPNGTLSGSALTMMKGVANLVQSVGIPLTEALRMASLYPAQLIKLNRLGRIAPGYLADMVVFNDQFEVQQVITGE